MNIVDIHSKFLETTGPCTDTRNILLDSMFFALKGGNFNGNEFALKAIEDGCKYAIIDENKYAIDDRFIKTVPASSFGYGARAHLFGDSRFEIAVSIVVCVNSNDASFKR